MHSPRKMESDELERMTLCARCLLDPSVTEGMIPIWLKSCRDAFISLLGDRYSDESQKNIENILSSEPDSLISFRQLRPRQAGMNDVGELDLNDAADISKATEMSILNDFSERLNRTFQLTGTADPVYCEAHVANHEYDCILYLFKINKIYSR